MAATASKSADAGWHASLSRRACLLAVCSSLALIGSSAHALDWDFTPRIGARATLTDNANRRAGNDESALILGVTPGFNLVSKGSRRVRASLQYGLTDVVRFGGRDNHDVFHRLSAVGKAEVVEDFLYVDASARISQELTSLFGSTADASTNSSNRTNVGTYRLSPYIRKRFGTFAEAELRTTASGVIFGQGGAGSSESQTVSATLASGTRFDDLSWTLGYFIRNANYKQAGDVTFERVSAQLGYALTPRFRMLGSIGWDNNDYLSRTATDGSSYSLGFGWAPSRRTSLEASAGERYFGRTYSLAGSHRTRHSRWSIRYAEDVSDITQQLLMQSSRLYFLCSSILVPANDALQPPPPDCQGPFTADQIVDLFPTMSEATLQGLELQTLAKASGVYVLKGLTASVTWDAGRLGLGLSAQDTRRLYQDFGEAHDRVQGVSGAISYRLSPHTIANTNLAYTRTSFDAALAGIAPREMDVMSLSVGVTHRFGPRLNGGLTLRHTQRDSNTVNASYDENSITATANMQF